MRRICSIGVGTTVYGRPCSRQIFAPSAFGQNAQKGNDDNENEHETRDGNSDCKVPLRKANCARIIGCLKNRIKHDFRHDIYEIDLEYQV